MSNQNDNTGGTYFSTIQSGHSRTPADGINVYSFALHPEQHQPSGTANFSIMYDRQLYIEQHQPTGIYGRFSRIDTSHLNLNLIPIIKPKNKLLHYEIKKINDECCSICYESYEIGNIINILKCEHHFCVDCIDKWTCANKTTCPMCRADLTNADEHFELSDKFSLIL